MSNNPILNNLLSELNLLNLDTSLLTIQGSDPYFPTPFKVGGAAAAVLGTQGLMLNQIWQLRGGKQQKIKVDVLAAGLSTKCVEFQLQNGKYPWLYNDPDYATVDFYKTKDQRTIFLHGGYPKLRDGILDILNCPHNRTRIAEEVLKWDAFELEDEIANRNLCGGVVRTHEEWLNSSQGMAISEAPLIRIEKIKDSKPKNFSLNTQQILSGIKVLDFTHVIAGPTSAKCLASMGAEVLHVVSPTRPRIPPFEVDTNHGKYSSQLNLNNQEDNLQAKNLAKDADLFIQSYRPDKFKDYGLDPKSLAEINDSIIYVDLCCYGHEGPWEKRAGFEQLAQAVTGMAAAQGSITDPKLAPTLPNDYITGYLAALGALIALYRRATEGGSYHVKISLCKSATWLQSLGTLDYTNLNPIPNDYINKYMLNEVGPFGSLDYFGHALELEQTPLKFNLPAYPLGYHLAKWYN